MGVKNDFGGNNLPQLWLSERNSPEKMRHIIGGVPEVKTQHGNRINNKQNQQINERAHGFSTCLKVNMRDQPISVYQSRYRLSGVKEADN